MKKENNIIYNSKGFTLVEVVVVTVILVVIATITIPSLTNYFSSKRSEKIEEEAKNVFESASVIFKELYAANSHSMRKNQDPDCIIDGDKNNSVDKNNCNECDMHKNELANKIMELAGLDMRNDDPCSVIVGVGQYKKYADPTSQDFDPEKAYEVYLVIYQPVFDKTVYYYRKGDDKLSNKWPFTGGIDRNNIKVLDGDEEVEIQLYYIKNGKDNNTPANNLWNGQIKNKTSK